MFYRVIQSCILVWPNRTGSSTRTICTGITLSNRKRVELDIQKSGVISKSSNSKGSWASKIILDIFTHKAKAYLRIRLKRAIIVSKSTKGHFQGQFNIICKIASGQGCDVNLVEAHYWFSKAYRCYRTTERLKHLNRLKR